MQVASTPPYGGSPSLTLEVFFRACTGLFYLKTSNKNKIMFPDFSKGC